MLLALDNKIELLADELVRESFDFGMTGDEIVRTVKARVKQHEAIVSGNTDKKKDMRGKGDNTTNELSESAANDPSDVRGGTRNAG
jgi:hypothetical protein